MDDSDDGGAATACCCLGSVEGESHCIHCGDVLYDGTAKQRDKRSNLQFYLQLSYLAEQMHSNYRLHLDVVQGM